MIECVGQLVERRVAVHLVFHRVEVHGLLARVGGHDLAGQHDPDAGAFLAAGVDVARHLDRHLGVGRVQAAAMLVIKARLVADKHFPQRPFVLDGRLSSCRLFLGGLLAGMGQCGVAHPGAVVPGLDPCAQAFAVAWAVATDHAPELGPVDRAEVVFAARLVPFQIGVRQGDAEDLGLRHRRVDELLAQLVIGDALDAPAHRLLGVRRILVGRAEHHQRRPPPAVHGVLHHGLLLGRALAHHHQQGLIALALMKTFLAADTDHGPRIGRIGAAAQRHLVHDGRPIDQPADHADIGPAQGRVVEDRAVLGAPAVQRVQHLVSGRAQGLGGGVEVQAMAGLVLHLGQQNRLTFQGRRAADPVALGQHADDLGMGMLADLAHQSLAVMLGHPVLGFDEVAGINAGFKRRLGLGLLGRLDLLARCVKPLSLANSNSR